MNKIPSSIKKEANVTVLRFKTSNLKNKLVYNTKQTDPLAITDHDLQRAKLGAKKLAKKKIHTSLKKITLLTPGGSKIQAFPIDLLNKDSEKSKIIQKVKNKNHKASSLLLTASESDSDDVIIKTCKTKFRQTKQINSVIYNRISNKSINHPKNIVKSSQRDFKKNTKRQKMIENRSKRKSRYKTKHNENKGKLTKRIQLIQRKTLKDYLPLIEQYRDLIPEKQPFVRLNRLQFSAVHFTKTRSRLSSDINILRDSAILFDLLGKIFNRLDLITKHHSSMVCRLWNRSIKEDTAWQNLPIQNVILYDLKKLERLIMKRETKCLSLDNVEIDPKTVDFVFSKLSSVKSLIVKSPCSDILINKLVTACSELEEICISDQNLNNYNSISISLKILNAENVIISEFENRILKTWSDLEKLNVSSFDPTFYFNMGLLLSLKYLKLKKLIITYNIAQFIENIPNIQYIEFTPEYSNISYSDGTKAVVESFKHCPSLRKITWIQGSMSRKEEHYKPDPSQMVKDANMSNFVPKMEIENFETENIEHYLNEGEFTESVSEKNEILGQYDPRLCTMCSKKSENYKYGIYDNGMKDEFHNKLYIKTEREVFENCLVDSLQSLSLKKYLKASLTDCEIIVK